MCWDILLLLYRDTYKCICMNIYNYIRKYFKYICIITIYNQIFTWLATCLSLTLAI